MSFYEHDQFFADFPEYADVTVFSHQTDAMNALVSEIKCSFPFFDDNSLLSVEHNCCISIPLEDKTFYVINIDEGYDFWSNVSWPLLVKDKDNEILRHFILQHEIGHILGSILNPYEYSTTNLLLTSEEDEKHKHMSEEYADCYAALKVIQQYDEDGIRFVQKISDSRLLSAVKSGHTHHLTSTVLDALCELAQKPDFISKISEFSPQELASLAQEITQANHQPTPDKEKKLSEWKEAIFYPSSDTLLYPSIPRLMDAIGRQVDVREQDLDDYLDRLDFKKGDLSQAFTRSSILKAIVGLKISLVNAEDMHDAQGHLEEKLSSDTKDWIRCSNQFPELSDFAKNIRATFVGDRFALLSALSSKEFTNDLAHKYLTRQAIKNIATCTFD